MEHNEKSSLQIIEIDKREESQVDGIGKTFNVIIEENVPKLKRHAYLDTRNTVYIK